MAWFIPFCFIVDTYFICLIVSFANEAESEVKILKEN